ncbi:MAG TPA: hypothetical protein VGN80_02930 [Devosiaceae bacterium]|jgi:hypothetical protein|nr:hypothetical protein [Devosiaceae bacterium]
MTPDEIFSEVQAGFGVRKYAAGLAVAFIDFLNELGVPANEGITDFDTFLSSFPRREFRSPGKRANTLIVDLPTGGTLGLRPFYNGIEAFFRAKNNRFDYPSCPGHATAQWRDYAHWLDAMCGFSVEELETLRGKICDFVLTILPSQAFDPASLVREPPLFEMVIEGFSLSREKGETTGAAYQGLVFGFVRADNPHLQVEISNVRTGSKRLQRVGDIDAWEGARLAITAEVKQYVLAEGDVEQLAAFANEANVRGAIGIVFSLGFEDGVRDRIQDLGVRALDTGDMSSIVSLWDPMKQRTAIASLEYYVKHVEKSSALATRLDAFIASSLEAFAAGEPSPLEDDNPIIA